MSLEEWQKEFLEKGSLQSGQPTAILTENNLSKAEGNAGNVGIKVTDVTEQYVRAATPGKGDVNCDDGYHINGHQEEIKAANWLRNTFGGNVRLLKESKEHGSKTPDFLWNERSWELKGVTSLNSIDRAVREAAKQIQDNPGGIILNLLDTAQSSEAIENAILQRARRINLDTIDVLLLSDGSLIRILRYQK